MPAVPRWGWQRVTSTGRDGTTTSRLGTCCGSLAYYPVGKGWEVLHIPTGLRVLVLPKEEQARQMVTVLQRWATALLLADAKLVAKALPVGVVAWINRCEHEGKVLPLAGVFTTSV